MKNDSIYCFNAYQDVVYLSSMFIIGLTIASTALAILTVAANVLVLYVLIATKQLNNTSTRLIFYLSISNACIGGIGLPAEIVIFLRNEKGRRCHSIELFSEFSMMFFGHVSGYITGLIGYDRYFRIKYLTRYNEIVNAEKMNLALFILTFIALLQAAFDIHFLTLSELFRIEMSTNILASMLAILPYVLSILKIRCYKKGFLYKQMIKTVNSAVTRTATGIIISITILYLPYITLNTIYDFLPDKSPTKKQSWFHGLRFTSYMLLHACAFVNALIFLSYNGKFRKKIVDIVSLFSKGEQDMIDLRVRNTRVAVV